MKVGVCVLGDVGRSPRMQYHAVSLAESAGHEVHLIGHSGERCVPAVERSARIRLCQFSPVQLPVARALFVLLAPLKVALQLLQLLWVFLVRLPRLDALLVQNPPSVPTLAVAWLAARLRGTRVVVDWHNLGFTVLAMRLGERHALVRVAERYERWFAATADAHLCVTRAMQTYLAQHFGVQATVLYDKPPEAFRRLAPADAHELFSRLADEFAPAAARLGLLGEELFTTADGALRADRPALVVSSTSWTPDEDFGVLLEALVALDAALPASAPGVVCVVTGKGPMKAHYEARMAELPLRKVAVLTMWLEAADYPRLLGAADVGVSLHTSTSGIDLPMKVLDMFGCGLPVCAVGFSCLDELVQHGRNGLVFSSADELAEQLLGLLRAFPESPDLARMRSELDGFARWRENWEENAGPVFGSLG